MPDQTMTLNLSVQENQKCARIVSLFEASKHWPEDTWFNVSDGIDLNLSTSNDHIHAEAYLVADGNTDTTISVEVLHRDRDGYAETTPKQIREIELRLMDRYSLIFLVCAYYRGYRHDGVDDETLIADILDYETSIGVDII